MVVFGAGASFDSSPDYPPSGSAYADQSRPPLANRLFDNRPLFVEALDQFPQSKPVIATLRGAASIETALTEIEEQSGNYDRGKRELAAIRCYLQRAIRECERAWRETTRGVTHHLRLLREIERTRKPNEPVCLVTFNYDTLLETALDDLGVPIQTMDDYTDVSRMFQLFKLHGSVNWANEIDTPLPGNVNSGNPMSVLRYAIDHAPTVQIGRQFVLCSAGNMGVANGRPAFPAIAIPVERKQIFECPAQMVDALTAQLPGFTKIITIGWRAGESSFLQLLNQHLKRGTYLCVIAGSQKDAQDTKVQICRNLPNNRPAEIEEIAGFTDFMRSRRLEEFLSI